MKIIVGDTYRDYMGVSYVVKSYKNSLITFEVDNGKMKDETYVKKEFISEIDGNRFHKVELPQQEISDEEIEKGANELSQKGVDIDYTWIMGAKWYREQLKQRQ